MNLYKNLKNNTFLNRSFSTIMLRGVGIALSFSMLLIITNLFPDDVVGKYQYFNSILIIMGTISLLGLNVSFIRFSGELIAASEQQKLKSLYYKNVLILFVSTVIIFLIYFVTRSFLLPDIIKPEDDKIYLLALLAIFPNCLSVLNFQVLLGLKKLYLSEFFRNVIKFSIIMISILAFYFMQKYNQLIEAFIYALIFIALISTLFILNILYKGFSYSKDRTNGVYSLSYKRILQVSIPMALSYISLLLMQQIDLLVLKRHSPFNDLAYYGVAVKISFLLNIILTAINQVIGPQVAELYYKNDRKSLEKVIGKSILLNNLLVIPLVIIIFIFPGTILNLFGENYIKAKVALLILVVGQAVNALAGSTDLYLNMTGKQNFFQRIIIIALIINLILNFILIPRFGMIGAATSTALSLVFWNILGVIYVRRVDDIVLILNFELLKKYLKNEK